MLDSVAAAPLSPILAIERAVQDRAKTNALDVTGPDGHTQLRTLIDEEILRWQNDFKRGLRPYQLGDSETLGQRVFTNIAGYGPLTSLLTITTCGKS